MILAHKSIKYLQLRQFMTGAVELILHFLGYWDQKKYKDFRFESLFFSLPFYTSKTDGVGFSCSLWFICTW